MKLKVGEEARWVSQAGGRRGEKAGTVLAVILQGDSLKMVLRRLKIDVPRRDVRADADISMFDRYLVEVTTYRKGAPATVYHVPKVRTVDGPVPPGTRRGPMPIGLEVL